MYVEDLSIDVDLDLHDVIQTLSMYYMSVEGHCVLYQQKNDHKSLL
jgi:hypothetical protein